MRRIDTNNKACLAWKVSGTAPHEDKTTGRTFGASKTCLVVAPDARAAIARAEQKFPLIFVEGLSHLGGAIISDETLAELTGEGE